MRMVDEEKFKELMKLKQELRATDVFGEHNKFWSIVSSTDNLTFKQYKELMGLVVMGGAIAYDIYLMKQWMKRETTAAKRFVERMEKRKVKG
jgi:hypothetical protein